MGKMKKGERNGPLTYRTSFTYIPSHHRVLWYEIHELLYSHFWMFSPDDFQGHNVLPLGSKHRPYLLLSVSPSLPVLLEAAVSDIFSFCHFRCSFRKEKQTFYGRVIPIFPFLSSLCQGLKWKDPPNENCTWRRLLNVMMLKSTWGKNSKSLKMENWRDSWKHDSSWQESKRLSDPVDGNDSFVCLYPYYDIQISQKWMVPWNIFSEEAIRSGIIEMTYDGDDDWKGAAGIRNWSLGLSYL